MLQDSTVHEVRAIPIGELFAPTADRYSVPIYQRNYTWGEEQIERLINDVLDEAGQPEPKDYFLGNLVVSPPEDPSDPEAPFDVIDGQQRLTTLYILLTILIEKKLLPLSFGPPQQLTYEAREKSTLALRGMARGEQGTSDPGKEREDSGILQARQIITEYLDAPKVKERLTASNFVEYLLSRVLLVRMPIERTTDLNKYFEIMNTRGAQLSAVDIVKARLLRCLKDPADRALLNHVWSSCSDMEHYVAMSATAGDTSWRAEVFGTDWDEVPTADFSELRHQLIDSRRDAPSPTMDLEPEVRPAAMSFDDALALYTRTDITEEVGEVLKADRFTSQITFPTLLLHVLAVQDHRDEVALDRQLDDKHLVKRFSDELEDLDGDGRERWVRNFTTNLLRVRFLFDTYVLKRDATLSSGVESTTDEEPGSWSLARVVRGESSSTGTVRYSPRYKPTFAADESGAGPRSLQRRILLLQSALRITYTSARTMHWLTDLLRYVTGLSDSGEAITAQGVLNRLEAHALARLEDALHPDPEKSKRELGPGGLPLGFHIPRIVFTYLDYLLVREDDQWDFTFSYRTSVEHFSPGTEDVEHASPAYHVRDRSLLDWLGNLALVTVSANSKFSNYQPREKANNRAARRLSLKLERMAQRAETGSWNDEDIRRHHEEMVELLDSAIATGRRPS